MGAVVYPFLIWDFPLDLGLSSRPGTFLSTWDLESKLSAYPKTIGNRG